MRLEDCRRWLKTFNFKDLFIEGLGWDNHSLNKSIPIDNEGNVVQLSAIAQKRGLVAFSSDTIPDAKVRLKINRQLTKLHREHFVIYTNQKAGKQVWYWVRHERGKPLSAREHHYDIKQSGDALIQKLNLIKVSIEDEEKIDLTEMERKTRKAFDVEKVTKRFYDRFSKIRVEFLNFIEGIPEVADREWYASVMINRLMFVYFIQRKGFLDGDHDYLRNRLRACKEKAGDGKFYTFYRYFLIRLFHEGLGKRREERKSGLEKILGKIPYLNGGIFDVHELESSRKYGKSLEIPDKAFEKIFDYFDQYQWNLDERPLRADNEINPDVLGFIFEKYINQKQMGAYYTKEDITEYISKNTIIPFLFDSVRARCPHHFENVDGPTIWDLQMVNPDRYIYPSVQHGKDLKLPSDVEKGLDTSSPNLIKRRKSWNKTAPEDFALPKEIWREVIARRDRYESFFKKLENGEIRNINDFITYNLDIRQFAQDVIDNCDDPELLQACWDSVYSITILDPTGGSGAFLFAALNILEPLYDACLEKMQSFLDEWSDSSEKDHSKLYKIFTEILKQIESHPNRRYFILKSIILKNLYAVDIMEEAVEICKLRLFLKLAAQVDPDDKKGNLGIEPLPDIDFNIRAGNSLVGFATFAEVKHSITSKFDFDDTMGKIQTKIGKIDERAAATQMIFDKFRHLQTEGKAYDIAELKQQLKKELAVLEDELNNYLAGEYGVREGDKVAYAKWVKSHQPFHWFIQFYSILKSGGFDVIIGNPPYVNFQKIEYTIRANYICHSCSDLFAICTERSYNIGCKQARVGLIIPLSATSTEKMAALKSIINKNSNCVWTSYFSASDQPASLFTGVRHRLMVLLSEKGNLSEFKLQTTRFLKWFNPERENLFNNFITYARTSGNSFDPFCKISSVTEILILEKLYRKKSLSHDTSESGARIYYHNAPVHWGKVFDFVPHFQVGSSRPQQSSHVKPLFLPDQNSASVALCLLNSSLFYWFNWQYSNCRDLSAKDILRVPLDIKSMIPKIIKKLVKLANNLMADFKKHKSLYSRKVNGVITEFDSFYPGASKPILDEIDTVLAEHYGFTEEELDFIINYDIKYRMGKEVEED